MSKAEDAWTSFATQDDGERKKSRNLYTERLRKQAFLAGWAAAGGDVRLQVIDQLNGLIGECCKEEAGEEFCENYGCGTLLNLISDLGGEAEHVED